MLKSYEALLDHGQVKWLAEKPSMENARIIVTVLAETSPPTQRNPSAAIVGKGKTLGDIISPISEIEDWECLK